MLVSPAQDGANKAAHHQRHSIGGAALRMLQQQQHTSSQQQQFKEQEGRGQREHGSNDVDSNHHQ